MTVYVSVAGNVWVARLKVDALEVVVFRTVPLARTSFTVTELTTLVGVRMLLLVTLTVTC